MPKPTTNSYRFGAVFVLTALLAYQFMDPLLPGSGPTETPTPTPFPTTGVDRAAQQDFMMTVDPTLGRVPTERLQQARNTMQSFAARGAQSEEFVEGSWENIPTEVAGRTRSTMFGGGKLWTGSVTGGVWSTEDYSGKTSWQSQAGLENFAPSCMVADPLNADVLYMGSGETVTAVHIYRSSTSRGQGIAKSTDGGATWTILAGTSGFNFISDLVIREEEGTSVLYAAVASGRYGFQDFNSQDGLYRSADGGETWTLVPLELPNETGFLISDLEIASNGTLLAGTMRNLSGVGGGYLFSSSNGT
ncbi:MAG: sialidase family protein, partial [Bacteroidota bacterium]